MNRLTRRRRGGLHDRLAQCRVRVNRLVEVLDRPLQLDHQPLLGNQLRRVGADDVRAVNLAGLGVADDFHETL